MATRVSHSKRVSQRSNTEAYIRVELLVGVGDDALFRILGVKRVLYIQKSHFANSS